MDMDEEEEKQNQTDKGTESSQVRHRDIGGRNRLK